MKTSATMRRFALCAALTFATGSAATAATPADTVGADRIEVTWTDPAQFAEVRQSPGTPLSSRAPEQWLGELAAYLRRRADRELPAGERLSVTFTDVKRAGSFEPWRGPSWNDVRIVKDIYPPRIALRFALTDASGATLKAGERTLHDSGFLYRSIAEDTDPLRYEKRMLDDWLRHEFGAPEPRAGKRVTGAAD